MNSPVQLNPHPLAMTTLPMSKLSKQLCENWSCSFVDVISKGKCLWIYDTGLPELFRPLLRKKISSSTILCQPRPANGDEAVAAAAQGRTDKALYAIINATSSLEPKHEHNMADPSQDLR